MKKILIAFFLTSMTAALYAQGIGIGTAVPHNSAILDISSNTKGMLVPRMTTTQRNAIASPAGGLLVYDTDAAGFYFYNGSAWTGLSAAASTDWKLTGNSGTNPLVHFIGTTDNIPLYFRVNNQLHGTLNSNGNIFFGKSAGASNNSYSNIAIGAQALYFNTDRNGLVAIGDSALMNNGLGAPGGSFARYNVAVGSKALYANNTGYGNTALGFHALMNNTSGYYNVAIGETALNSNQDGFRNIGIGYNALNNTTSGTINLAIGNEALESNITGNNNLAIGNLAMNTASSAFGNTAIGHSSLQFNTTGGSNTAIGETALKANTTGALNVAIGRQSMLDNTTGLRNIGIGFNALSANTTASDNVAVGYFALSSNTTADSNVAVGSYALRDNITGHGNTASGYQALANNTNDYNTGVGINALLLNTSGASNSALGAFSLSKNSFGFSNAAVGVNSMKENTSGWGNTAIGYSSLVENTTGYWNFAAGYNTGFNTTTAIGTTAIGYSASALNYTYSTALGAYSTNTAENQVLIGDEFIGTISGYVSYSELSDKRFKKNIQKNVPGLDFIMRLSPVTYHYDMQRLAGFLGKDKAPQSMQSEKEIAEWEKRQNERRSAKEAVQYTGFLAQDVEAAAKSIGYDFSGVKKPQSDKDHYGIAYSEFVVPLVKAVQEQQAMIEALTKEVEALKKSKQ